MDTEPSAGAPGEPLIRSVPAWVRGCAEVLAVALTAPLWCLGLLMALFSQDVSLHPLHWHLIRASAVVAVPVLATALAAPVVWLLARERRRRVRVVARRVFWSLLAVSFLCQLAACQLNLSTG